MTTRFFIRVLGALVVAASLVAVSQVEVSKSSVEETTAARPIFGTMIG